MPLVYGATEELYGFAEFDPARILANLERYFIGDGYPVLAQMLVLQKGTSCHPDPIRRDVFAELAVDSTGDTFGEER